MNPSENHSPLFDPSPELQLEDAIQRVRSGERTAFSTIVKLTEIKLRIILAAMLPNSNTIEDVLQEAYLTAYRKLDNYQAGTDFVSWMKTITRNLALNERRRWIREQSLKQKFQVDLEEKIKIQHQELMSRDAEDMAETLNECIEKLDEPFREVVREFYFKHSPSKQIAEKLGKSDGAVRLMLLRSRTAIATCLKNKKAI